MPDPKPLADAIADHLADPPKPRLVERIRAAIPAWEREELERHVVRHSGGHIANAVAAHYAPRAPMTEDDAIDALRRQNEGAGSTR
jgi:hypothetical protein